MLKACGIFTPMSRHDQTARRKLDHIKLCSDEEIDKVSYVEKSTLLECVEILPVYFPTCPLDKIDTKAAFLGKTVSAPVMISAITGGAAEAAGLNRTLAEVCQELGIPFGLGSGRIMFEDPASAESFKVRSAAPGIPIIANIGISQAEELSGEQLTWMVTELEADALAIHINFAMEAFQPEGDRQPATVVETILRIKSEVTFPIIVKEVGTGFSMQQLELLKTCDVEWLDVAGAGGTNWIKIEALRADDRIRQVVAPFLEWGVPTAVSLIWAKKAGHEKIIASGGIRNGLEAAKALALGARMCGLALPVLRIIPKYGKSGVLSYLTSVIDQLKVATYLCGVDSARQLSNVQFVIRDELRDWFFPSGLQALTK
jgi:isopentenyl-diphosphate delta-isomerase